MNKKLKAVGFKKLPDWKREMIDKIMAFEADDPPDIEYGGLIMVRSGPEPFDDRFVEYGSRFDDNVRDARTFRSLGMSFLMHAERLNSLATPERKVPKISIAVFRDHSHDDQKE